MTPIYTKCKGINFFSLGEFLSPSCLILVLLLTSYYGKAQTIYNSATVGGQGNESLVQMLPINDEVTLFASTFSESISLGDSTFQAVGGDDILLFGGDIYSPTPLLAAGSLYNDKITAVATDVHFCEDLYVAGYFWNEMMVYDSLLSSNGLGKAAFLLHYDLAMDGLIYHTKVIKGTGEKEIADIVMDSSQVIITGYFSDTLYIGDTILVAEGHQAVFVAKWNHEGDFVLAQQWSSTGMVASIAMELIEDDKLVIAGVFDDTLTMGGELITANTYDDDVFVACLTKNFEPVWLKKIGGVYDKKLSDIAVNDNDEVILTGGFIGVVKAGDQQIQSSNGWDDTYVCKLDNEGSALFLEKFSGSTIDESLAIATEGEYWGICGFFDQNIVLGDIELTTAYPIAGFSVFLDDNNEVLQAWKHESTATLYPTQIGFVPDSEKVIVGGNFTETIELPNEALTSAGGRDIFLLEYRKEDVLTAVATTQIVDEKVRIFPNPVSDLLHIDAPWNVDIIEVFSVDGRKVLSCQSCNDIDISQLVRGTYFAKIYRRDKFVSREFVVE